MAGNYISTISVDKPMVWYYTVSMEEREMAEPLGKFIMIKRKSDEAFLCEIKVGKSGRYADFSITEVPILFSPDVAKALGYTGLAYEIVEA